jgi:hypothetical protein
LGTILSTAVLANTAAPDREPAASSQDETIASRRMSVALMAFSQAITWSGAEPGARAAMPLAIAGATNFRICGPTAVVTISAVEISSISCASWVLELMALKLSTVRTAGFSPTSCTS